MNARSVTLAWPTTGRRDTLSPSVRGFCANAREHRHEPQVLIALDEASAESVESVGDLVHEVEREYRLPARLMTHADQLALVTERGGGDPDAARFALGITPAGRRWRNAAANHNALRLLSAGGTLISTDDDVFPRFARTPSAGDAAPDDPRFSTLYLPVPLHFRTTRDETLARVSETQVDVISEHTRFLGVQADAIFPAALPRGARADARVLISTSGAYGDCAMSSARTILSLEGENRDAAFTSDERYRAVRLSRELVRIPESPVVGPGTHLMGMHMGLDATQLLPPFFPIGRNSDGLSSVMTRLIHPASLTAFLGYGVYHNPGEDRRFTREQLVGLHPVPSDFIMALVVRFRPEDTLTGPADRMRDLGETLVTVADTDAGTFAEIVHESWAASFDAYAERLEELLAFYDESPASWAEDMKEHLDRVEALLEDGGLLWGEKGCGVTAEEMREAAGLYGRLLRVWPEMVRAGL